MRNTRTRSLQQGQAIVLIALLILVLFGMLGLAVDSGRGYVDRRDQQTAVDAAALAAGDWYENTFSITDPTQGAIPNSLTVYEADLRLYSAPTPGTPPSSHAVGAGGALTEYDWDYLWAGGYELTIAATNTQFNGYQFVFTSTHNLPLAFIQIFGGSPTIAVGATATSIVGNQRQTPALLTLSNQACATTVTGTSQVTVLGDVYTNGTECVTGNLHVAGNCYGAPLSDCSTAQYYCYNATPGFIPYPPPCLAGDIQGVPVVPAPSLPDPGYLAPSQPSYTTLQSLPTGPNRGTWGELQPGYYPYFHLSGGNTGCYFLDPGVYTWTGGYQSDANNSLVSNELKAPDEDLWSNPATSNVANPQFWNMNQSGAGCAGDFNLAMVPTPGGNGIAEKGSRIKTNQWGVELTSVRFDTFNDPAITPDPCFLSPGCARESAPSECQLTPGNITNNGTTGLDINITKNAPGAQYYNVYLDVNGCDGIQSNFGFYARFLAPGFRDAGGTPTITGNPYLGGAPPATPDGSLLNPYPSPSAITLGYSTFQPAAFSTIMNFNHFGVLYTPPHCGTLARTLGCQGPDAEAAPQCFSSCPPPPGLLSQENAPMLLQTLPFNGGDTANENYCVSQSAGTVAAPCQGAQITPGAVQFYFPASQCMSQQAQGATYVFTGIQYNWIIIYAPPANICNPNKLNGGAYTQYIGTIYTPAAVWQINGGNRSPLAGQVICWSATLAGNSNVGIDYNPNYAPAPPAARLIN